MIDFRCAETCENTFKAFGSNRIGKKMALTDVNEFPSVNHGSILRQPKMAASGCCVAVAYTGKGRTTTVNEKGKQREEEHENARKDQHIL